MVKRIGSSRRKTRQKYTKSHRRKGKISLTKYFQEFKTGDQVLLQLEPAVNKGVYHPRFFGKTGKVIGKSGKSYKIRIQDMKKEKTLVVHPVHLTAVRK